MSDHTLNFMPHGSPVVAMTVAVASGVAGILSSLMDLVTLSSISSIVSAGSALIGLAAIAYQKARATGRKDHQDSLANESAELRILMGSNRELIEELANMQRRVVSLNQQIVRLSAHGERGPSATPSHPTEGTNVSKDKAPDSELHV